MARGRCTFRQRDLTAAIKAAIAAGLEGASVVVTTDGTITVKIGRPAGAPGGGAPDAANDNPNPWDKVLTK